MSRRKPGKPSYWTNRSVTMPITPFLRGQAFDPKTVEVMGKAFVTTCEALGLTDRTDAMTELVAQKIIELAQRGFKNPFALHVAAMQEFESDPERAGPAVGRQVAQQG